MSEKKLRDKSSVATATDGAKSRPDYVLVIGSIIVVALVVIALLMWPDEAQNGASTLLMAPPESSVFPFRSSDSSALPWPWYLPVPASVP